MIHILTLIQLHFFEVLENDQFPFPPGSHFPWEIPWLEGQSARPHVWQQGFTDVTLAGQDGLNRQPDHVELSEVAEEGDRGGSFGHEMADNANFDHLITYNSVY